MNNLNNQITIAYKCNLNKIDDELKDQKLTTLLQAGYEIKSIIPVEDSGIPTAILILNKNNNNKKPYTILHYLTFLFCSLHLLFMFLQTT